MAFVERRLTQYRVPLFEALRAALARRDIELRVLHGDPLPAEIERRDEGRLAWAEHLTTRYLAGGRIVWQPFRARIADADLVVVSHENKLLHNHLALGDPRRRPALAFFGHGRDLQAGDIHPAREWFKRQTARRADWWFAYTQLSADIVATTGFPRSRITVVDNSIDTRALRAAIDEARQRGDTANRQLLGLPLEGTLVAFIGSLVPEKRVARLLEVAERLHGDAAPVVLAVAGDGPERPLLQAATRADRPGARVHALGPVAGERKAALLACCALLLNPGAVGLGVLDAFAAGVPLVTADGAGHGPEIAYLVTEHNGLIVADADLSDAVQGLLDDPGRCQSLGAAARLDGRQLSIEHMVGRFVQGIEDCLSQRRGKEARP